MYIYFLIIQVWGKFGYRGQGTELRLGGLSLFQTSINNRKTIA